jgi:hypothetical protein
MIITKDLIAQHNLTDEEYILTSIKKVAERGR